MSKSMYTGTIRILTINDIYQNLPNTNGVGGWATISTLIQQYKHSTSNQCIVIVNGDFLGGNALAEYTQGQYVIEILNHIGVNYVVIGNHECDFGSSGLEQCMNLSLNNSTKLHWLGSNVRNNDSDKTLFHYVTDYITENIKLHRKHNQKCNGTDQQTNGVTHNTIDGTIGLFGLTTPSTPLLSFPGDAIMFDDLKQHCTRVIQQLQHTDTIIAVTHLSMTEDKTIAQHSRTCAKPITLQLAGHDHELAVAVVDDTTIVKSEQNANRLGVIDLTVEIEIDDTTQQRTCNTYTNYQFIMNKDIECDPGILGIVDKYQKQMDNDTPYSDVDKVIAVVQYDTSVPDSYFDVCDSYLCTHSSIVRTQETVFAQLIADAMQRHYLDEHCDCAIINGGFIRNNSEYQVGTQITIRALLAETPFPKHIVLVRISGQHLHDALEFMVSHHPTAVGVFVSGLSSSLKVHVDLTAPPMHRIKKIYIDDILLDPSKLYRVSISTFMLLGGDNNIHFTHGTKISKDSYKIGDVFVKYIAQHKQTIDPRLKRRLIVT